MRRPLGLSVFLASLSLAFQANAGVEAIAPLAPAALSSDPTIVRTTPLAIDPQLLRAAAEHRDVLDIELPGAGVASVRFSTFEARGGASFLASARSDDGTRLTLAVRGGAVAASVVTAEGRTYQIRTSPDGGHELREMDHTRFPPCGNADAEGLGFAPPPRPLPGRDRDGAHRSSGMRGAGACPEDGSVVDLLVCYTDAAATAEGGTANMLALIDLGLMETNQALADSGVALTIRLAATAEVPKTWATTSSATILNHMSETGSGTLDEIHALRDQHSADLVTLFVNSLDVCGRAYLAVAPGPTPLPELGFNVVGRACVGAPTYALAHELAHNFGLRHDRASDPCDAGCTEAAHAYVEPTDAFSTILSSGSAAPRVPHFSNPDVLYTGLPTGVAGDADNASAVALAAPAVAGFRSLDCNGNGLCDADEIAGGADDLDANGRLDECEADLNNNAVVDAFDISSGASLDLNTNGIPDEAEPTRIYVDPLATGTGLGDSWANARTNLQTALSIAQRSGGLVLELWVAAGVYTPAPAPARAVPFQLVSGVEVYGGFAGDETDLSERDWRANPTILSGDLLGDDGPDFANYEDNAVSVVWASYTDDTAVLDGFFIQGGSCAFDTGDCWFTPYSGGGGIRCFDGDAIIRNCSVERNVAQNGGGAFVVSSGSPDFFGCDFIGNQAIGYLLGASAGAMYLSAEGGAYCRVENCRFLGNYSDGSGGGVVNICQDGTFLNCLFAHNVSRIYSGGAISNSGACGSDPTIANCTFAYNICISNSVGGGVYNFKSAPIMSNCVFWGNARNGTIVDEVAQLGSFNPSYPYDVNSTIVAGWTGGHPGVGSYEADPLFADPDGPDDIPGTTDDDFTLLPGSPAIDSGDNDLLQPTMTTDLAGAPRRADDPDTIDSGLPGADAPYVDRGAYEVQSAAPPACPGDIDGDDDTDVFDFGEFLINFGASGLAPFTSGDLDGDGDADVFDFTVFLIDFGCPN